MCILLGLRFLAHPKRAAKKPCDTSVKRRFRFEPSRNEKSGVKACDKNLLPMLFNLAAELSSFTHRMAPSHFTKAPSKLSRLKVFGSIMMLEFATRGLAGTVVSPKFENVNKFAQ